VPGSIVWSTGAGAGTTTQRAFWRPAKPLVAGRSYRVADLPDYSHSQGEVFTVSPAMNWLTTEELEFKAGLEVGNDGVAGDISCDGRRVVVRCFPPQPAPPSTIITLNTRWQTYLSFEALATHPETGRIPPLKRRTVRWRDGDERPDLASTAWVVSEPDARVTEQATRYCYHSAVHNLLDGSEREWEGCLDHADRPALETLDASPEQLADEVGRCKEPPAGLEKTWCEWSTLACQRESGMPQQSDCENVAKRCAADAEDAGTDDANHGAHLAGARAARDSGCSVTRGANGSSAMAWWLVSTAIALVTRCARRRIRAFGVDSKRR